MKLKGNASDFYDLIPKFFLKLKEINPLHLYYYVIDEFCSN